MVIILFHVVPQYQIYISPLNIPWLWLAFPMSVRPQMAFGFSFLGSFGRRFGFSLLHVDQDERPDRDNAGWSACWGLVVSTSTRRGRERCTPPARPRTSHASGGSPGPSSAAASPARSSAASTSEELESPMI